MFASWRFELGYLAPSSRCNRCSVGSSPVCLGDPFRFHRDRAGALLDERSQRRPGGSFEEIARSENKVERHIRHLAPLAFVSPRIVEAIANGSAPADLTVTSLTSALPRSWTKQEKEKRYGRDRERVAALHSRILKDRQFQ
jgi:hypothetical protein